MSFSLQLAISLIIVVYGTAMIFDWVLSEKNVVEWQEKTQAPWGKFDQITWLKVLSESSVYFNDLFDLIYGRRIISWKRFYRSILSSLFAVFAFSLLYGADRIWFFQIEMFAITHFLMNIVADYFSIQETKWVLSKVRPEKPKSVFGWIFFDLLSTSLIFFLSWMLMYSIYQALIDLEDPTILNNAEIFFGWFLDFRIGFGIFFLSTFFTSFIWFIFVAFVLLVRVGEAVKVPVKLILNLVYRTGKPAQLFATVFSLTVLTIYFVSLIFVSTISRENLSPPLL